jgi:radical SAM superfamily enzyme YgiQ (UPF0313 family)
VLLALPAYRGQNHSLFLGVASLAASLRAAGAEVAVYDADVAAEAERLGTDSRDAILARMLAAFEPTLLGIHVNTPNYAAALILARRLRDLSSAPLVAGGPHATMAAECLLRHHREIDFVLLGEADLSLVQLAQALSRPAPATARALDEVPGLVRRASSLVVANPRGPLLPLDRIATPDRRALLQPPDPVLASHARATYRRSFYSTVPGFTGLDVAGAYATRGCDAGCAFCSPSVFWADPLTARPSRRLRPAQSLIAELREIRDLGYGAVFFDEPTFPLASAPAWCAELSAGLRATGLLWGAPTRLDEIRPADLPELARRGLRYLYFGLETPHPTLQERLAKPSAPAAVRAVLAACDASGIQCDLALFFGAPGESPSTIDSTLDWLDRELPRGNAFFSVAAFWPGTPWSAQIGLGPECWEPTFDRDQALPLGAIWYPEDATSIDCFYSNSTGTYHPAWLTPEVALSIKQRILDSGFRARFSQYARTRDAMRDVDRNSSYDVDRGADRGGDRDADHGAVQEVA